MTEKDGKVIRVGDVADVVVGHQPLIGDAVINDGEGLMMVVEKLPWGNTLDVTEGVEAAIEEMLPGLTGVEIDTTIFRPATFVEVALENLFRALTIGLVLVAVILTLFLFNWRSAVISLVAIPMSLVAAGLVLWWRDTTVNTMVLAGLIIAVGVVVDDAIIDIENIMRRLRQAKAEGTPVLDAENHPRGVDRGPQRDHLRHADRRCGRHPRLLHGRADGRVLPAARHLLCPGRARLDGGGDDRHAGDGVHPLLAIVGSRPARIAVRALAQAPLQRAAEPDRAAAAVRLRIGGRHRRSRTARLPDAGPVVAPGVQGA